MSETGNPVRTARKPLLVRTFSAITLQPKALEEIVASKHAVFSIFKNWHFGFELFVGQCDVIGTCEKLGSARFNRLFNKLDENPRPPGISSVP